MSEQSHDAPISAYIGGTIIALLFTVGFSKLGDFELGSATAVVVGVLLVGWTLFAVADFGGTESEH